MCQALSKCLAHCLEGDPFTWLSVFEPMKVNPNPFPPTAGRLGYPVQPTVRNR